MPQFQIEFEVFCGTCGDGLCHASDTRSSHRRSMPQVTVEACQICINNAKEPLESRIDELERELAELQEQMGAQA